jgi:hypothetical protein
MITPSIDIDIARGAYGRSINRLRVLSTSSGLLGRQAKHAGRRLLGEAHVAAKPFAHVPSEQEWRSRPIPLLKRDCLRSQNSVWTQIHFSIVAALLQLDRYHCLIFYQFNLTLSFHSPCLMWKNLQATEVSDKQAIVDGRITVVALLKDVCGLNRREVSALTASGITSLLAMRRLKEDRFDNMFAQIRKARETKAPAHQNWPSPDLFRETQEQYLKALWSETKIRHEIGWDIEDIRNIGVN